MKKIAKTKEKCRNNGQNVISKKIRVECQEKSSRGTKNERSNISYITTYEYFVNVYSYVYVKKAYCNEKDTLELFFPDNNPDNAKELDTPSKIFSIFPFAVFVIAYWIL